MKMHLPGLAAASSLLTPIAAFAQTEIQCWRALTGRLGELVADQVDAFNAGKATTPSCRATRATTPRH